MKKILFVEDDPNFSCIVKENLEDSGYEVVLVDSGEASVQIVSEVAPDVVLMDVELSGEMNGFDAAEEIRKGHPVLPVLFATARQSGPDLERGFRLPPMDYVRKPYRIKEILLRLQGLLGGVTKEGNLLCFGQISFDPVLRRLYVKGQEIRLSHLEAMLLMSLFDQQGKVLEKDQLIATLWGEVDDPKGKESSLHNLVYSLRKYLKADGSLSLEVVSKKGYRLIQQEGTAPD
jgi:two-component system alkaline phosphatase synthesis response regulator PhoP